MLFDQKLPFSLVVLLEDVTGVEVTNLETQDKAVKQLAYVRTEDARDLLNIVMEIFKDMYRIGDNSNVDITKIDVEKEIAELRIMLKQNQN